MTALLQLLPINCKFSVHFLALFLSNTCEKKIKRSVIRCKISKITAHMAYFLTLKSKVVTVKHLVWAESCSASAELPDLPSKPQCIVTSTAPLCRWIYCSWHSDAIKTWGKKKNTQKLHKQHWDGTAILHIYTCASFLEAFSISFKSWRVSCLKLVSRRDKWISEEKFSQTTAKTIILHLKKPCLLLILLSNRGGLPLSTQWRTAPSLRLFFSPHLAPVFKNPAFFFLHFLFFLFKIPLVPTSLHILVISTDLSASLHCFGRHQQARPGPPLWLPLVSLLHIKIYFLRWSAWLHLWIIKHLPGQLALI